MVFNLLLKSTEAIFSAHSLITQTLRTKHGFTFVLLIIRKAFPSIIRGKLYENKNDGIARWLVHLMYRMVNSGTLAALHNSLTNVHKSCTCTCVFEMPLSQLSMLLHPVASLTAMNLRKVRESVYEWKKH